MSAIATLLNQLADHIVAKNEKPVSVEFEFDDEYIKVIGLSERGFKSVLAFIIHSETDSQFHFGSILKPRDNKSPFRNFSRGNISDISSAKLDWEFQK